MQRALYATMALTMRAVRVNKYGGPEVLGVETVPRPLPAQDEVLIRVRAAGVNPVDTYTRAGNHPSTPPTPFTPGGDCAGVVEQVGTGVTTFRPGDRVYTVRTRTGAYAQYAVANAQHVGFLHEKLSFAEGAGVGVPCYTAYRALFQKARARAGQTVLIHGASGAVGLSGVRMAVSHGLTVLGTAGTEGGMDAVKKAGAHGAFNHTADGYTDDILAATGGKGADVIMEMLANVNLNKDMQLVAPGGTILIIGSRGAIEMEPRGVMGKESCIQGVALFACPRHEWDELHAAIKAGQEAGWVRPTVGQEYPLDQAGEAQIEVIAHAKGTKGKIVLLVD